MRSGNLDRRITIQTLTAGKGSQGGPTESWSTLATVWAGKRDLSGREFIAAQQVNSEVTTVFTIRWRNDITAKMQVVCDGKTYGVHFTKELGRREGLEIMAGVMNG